MSAVTIRQVESAPESYPSLGIEGEHAFDVETVAWQRVESYIAHRYAEREVVWIVEGCGEWMPPLAPATIESSEVWSGAAEWEAVSVTATAFGGFVLPATGPYRFVATVGGGTAPDIVLEAARRLANYLLADAGKAGASFESLSLGTVDLSHRRSESWMARAIQNSGAADLLRPYRRA